MMRPVVHFKGRVWFHVYNANKLAKFDLSLFEICEAKSGYICAFDIYTGKDQTRCTQTEQVLDPSCTTTKKLVVGLMDSVHLLDKGHCTYMDNFYTSPELYEGTFSPFCMCLWYIAPKYEGPAKSSDNCKTKDNRGSVQMQWSTIGYKMVWQRVVTVLTTTHAVVFVETNKIDEQGIRILKPLVIVNYIRKLGGCDTSDQLISYCSFLWKSVKWLKKLSIHLLNMLLLNPHILNSKYGCKKLDHHGYMEYMANYLITEGSVNCSLVT